MKCFSLLTRHELGQRVLRNLLRDHSFDDFVVPARLLEHTLHRLHPPKLTLISHFGYRAILFKYLSLESYHFAPFGSHPIER